MLSGAASLATYVAETGENFDQPRPLTGPATIPAQRKSVNRGQIRHRQQITLLLVAMLSSKGASGVSGAGFITLAATLAAVPSIPIQSLALLVGIDRFMSECRAITNLIGNGVATIVISRLENEVGPAALNEALGRPKSIVDIADETV